MADENTMENSLGYRHTRRSFLRMGSAGALIATAGCSGTQDEGTQDEGTQDGENTQDDERTQDGTAASGTRTEATESPTQTTRSETATQTETSESITIGVLAPAPEESLVGTAIKNTAELIAQQINSRGGLLGSDLAVVSKPTSGRAARLNFQRVVRRDSADVVVGLGDNAAGLSAFGELADNPVPILCTGAPSMQTNSLLNDDYDTFKYWFRLHPNGEQMGRAIAAFASSEFENMGWTDVAVVTEETSYFAPARRAFVTHRPEFTNLTFESAFSPDTSDFTPILNRGSSNNIDGMVVFSSRGEASLGAQWATERPDFGLGGWDTSASVSPQYGDAGGTAQYVWSGIPGPSPHAAPTQLTLQFIDEYRATYGSPPPHTQAYLAHDGLMAWKTAVEAAGTTAADAVVSELESISVTGTAGTIQFYPDGHEWVHDPRYGKDGITPPVIQVQKSKGDIQHTGLWPAGIRSRTYQLPPWTKS